MANLETLTMGKDGFGANPQNINREGRPKGSRNRATILAELLALPADTHINQEYKMIQALIDKAQTGDVAAIKEAQDTIYGKIPDKVLTAETDKESLERDVTEEALKHVPTEELERILDGKTD